MLIDNLLKQKNFTAFNGNATEPSLAALCLELLTQQKTSWQELSHGYTALDNIRVRELRCSGFSVKLQFNPARIISTAAPVDKISINKRPCFLCLENLPDAQRGIIYRHDFIILCNPYPIFPKHFTVSHIRHMPQSLEGALSAFLSVAKDFGPDFNVFYNGPHSGASAPDHMHFQAAPVGVLPIEKEIEDSDKRILMKHGDGVSLLRIKNMGREIIIIEGNNCGAVSTTLMNVISALKSVLSTPDEPMMNLLCSYKKNAWRVVIFPRRKHRPDVYFLPGSERILISPGLVDMGGFIITPIEKDFIAIDHVLIQTIYKEISVDAETIQKAIEAISL
jgi:hypothetical protein